MMLMTNYCMMSTDFKFGRLKKIVEMDGDDGYMTLWMYVMPLNYTFENV